MDCIEAPFSSPRLRRNLLHLIGKTLREMCLREEYGPGRARRSVVPLRRRKLRASAPEGTHSEAHTRRHYRGRAALRRRAKPAHYETWVPHFSPPLREVGFHNSHLLRILNFRRQLCRVCSFVTDTSHRFCNARVGRTLLSDAFDIAFDPDLDLPCPSRRSKECTNTIASSPTIRKQHEHCPSHSAKAAEPLLLRKLEMPSCSTACMTMANATTFTQPSLCRTTCTCCLLRSEMRQVGRTPCLRFEVAQRHVSQNSQ